MPPDPIPPGSALGDAAKDANQNFGANPVGAPAQTCGTAPPPSAVANQPSDLTVNVSDASTGQPIAGAKVAISGPQTSTGTTNAAGTVEFKGVTPGSYKVKATYRGYAENSVNTSVAPASSVVANVNLTPLTILILELSFLSDFDLNEWSDDSAKRIAIVDPVWKSGGLINKPACYKMGSDNIKLAPKLQINPRPTQAETLSLRAEVSSPALKLEKSGITVSSGTTSQYVSDVSIVSGKFDKNVQILQISIQWSYSWDGGGTWKKANNTGLHKVYLVYNTPIESPLFVFALDKACGYATGESTSAGVAAKINKGIPSDLKYDPGFAAPGHVLGYYGMGSCLCQNNAALMAYLCRSVGLAASMVYVWGGRTATEQTTYDFTGGDVSFRVLVPAKDSADENPHFTYHVQTRVSGVDYDPSYGNVGLITLNETAPAAPPQPTAGRQTKLASVVSGEPGGWPPWSTRSSSGWKCPHTV